MRPESFRSRQPLRHPRIPPEPCRTPHSSQASSACVRESAGAVHCWSFRWSHGATNGAAATLSRRRAPADTSMLSGRSAVESSDVSAQKDGVTASWPRRMAERTVVRFSRQQSARHGSQATEHRKASWPGLDTCTCHVHMTCDMSCAFACVCAHMCMHMCMCICMCMYVHHVYYYVLRRGSWHWHVYYVPYAPRVVRIACYIGPFSSVDGRRRGTYVARQKQTQIPC